MTRSHGSGNEAPDDHGIFLWDLRVHGLHDRGIPGTRKESGTDGHRDLGFLRIPDRVGLYGLCVFSDDPVPVSALQLFLVAHGARGDPVFCTCVPEGDGEDRGNAELTGGVEREMILVWMAGRWVIERA